MSENGDRPDRPYKNVAHAEALEARIGSGYPSPHDEKCRQRAKTVLGDAVGLSQFGVNLLLLQPGGWSALRHWHEKEDELIYVLEGEVSLLTDEGETLLTAGDVAGFPAGVENGHHLVNNSDAIVKILEVGTRSRIETAHYSDVDMKAQKAEGTFRFLRKNGELLA